MKKWFIMGLVLGWLALAWVQGGFAQQRSSQPLRFNPETVETVQGIVVDAPVIQQGGLPEMEHLALKTDRERLMIILGPNWYLAQQDLKISALDRLEVTGSRVPLDGKSALLAQKVKRGDQVFEFRDQAGKPRWAPSRPQPR